MRYVRSKLIKTFLLISAVCLIACEDLKVNTDLPTLSQDIPSDEKLFTIVPSKASGIDFINHIEESEGFNYYKYIYAYIGGGVAAADFNNDGLIDLFFISNLGENKLYLNKGNFTFEDISAKAGINENNGFKTGVSVTDINQDGFLDIYICRAGWFKEDSLYANLLYINNGNLTFSENAKEYGLNDMSRSISSTFFDYDKDGDLDVYICNSPEVTRDYRKIHDLDSIIQNPKTLTLKGSDKLYQNDGTGHFSDVSLQVGILPDRGFGLNAQVTDLNQDGWLDIYVSNDFEMPDFAYLNNGDGTFSEGRDKLLKHMSYYSMGSDAADINNDGLIDLIVLDMNPEDYIRSKTTMAMTSPIKFQTMIDKGYHYQYMHNMLQLNNGNSTFSEISQMAGVANTDWSWSVLLADFDLDGYNDIYVTNGIYRDVIDQDKTKEILATLRRNGRKPTDADFLRFTQMLPQQKLANYFFKNTGSLSFEDKSEDWVETAPSFSNGAAYADLDNDGDLDIIVNNLNEEATILKNNAREATGRNFLQFEFKESQKNTNAVGTKVNLHLNDGSVQTRLLINNRGFLSFVSSILHFGLDKKLKIPKVEVVWPDGKIQVIFDVKVNQKIAIEYSDAKNPELGIADTSSKSEKKIFKKAPFEFKHEDLGYNDYQKQLLLPHKLSQTGPGAAMADVNGDGIQDLFIGGGHKQQGKVLLGLPSGNFKEIFSVAFEQDKQYEDVGACFLDADMDGDQDLYVVSGSYEFASNSPLLQDRLYLNNGTGVFERSKNIIPEFREAGSIACSADFDNDGDPDLFVGGRVISGKYPYTPTSYVLVNDQGKFKILTDSIASELKNIGMVTDATWKDIDQDNYMDLIVTGEWMGIEVFLNKSGLLIKSDDYKPLTSSVGWWNKVLVQDIDDDGDMDIIAGNLGLNYKFHASSEEPFNVFTKDFDANGTEDIVLTKYYGEKKVPVRGKTCMTQQMPHLAFTIPTFRDFATRELVDIVGSDLSTALHYEANEFRSGIFVNEGNNRFLFRPFDNLIQKSPINSILYEDFDGDGIRDLLLAGNNYQSEIETTRADAGTGSFLKGKIQGKFEVIPSINSGFVANKDVRNIVFFESAPGIGVIVINNNNLHDLFHIQ